MDSPFEAGSKPSIASSLAPGSSSSNSTKSATSSQRPSARPWRHRRHQPAHVRDGRADWIGQPEASFRTKVILSLYSHPDLDAQSRVFVGFYLIARDSSEIQLLAGRMKYTAGQPYDTRRLATALSSARIGSTTEATLPYLGKTTSSTWRYDRRDWQPNRAADDIAWTLTRIAHALPAQGLRHETA